MPSCQAFDTNRHIVLQKTYVNLQTFHHCFRKTISIPPSSLWNSFLFCVFCHFGKGNFYFNYQWGYTNGISMMICFLQCGYQIMKKQNKTCLIKYCLPKKDMCIINTWYEKFLDDTFYYIFAFTLDYILKVLHFHFFGSQRWIFAKVKRWQA